MAKKPKNLTPVLPGMFTFPTLEEANELRDRAMVAVGAKAEDVVPEFSERVREFTLSYLRKGPASAELITVAAKNAGIVPHDDRAFGGVYFGMSRRGEIVKVGTCRRARGHGTTGGNVWGLPCS